MSKSKFRIRSAVAVACAVTLGACSERYIVAANDEVLVVMEDLSTQNGLKTATVHYTPAKPVALGDRRNSMMVATKVEATFNCSDGTLGQNAMHIVTADGETTEQRYPAPTMEQPRPGSMTASVYRVACEDDARASASVRRSLATLQKAYAEQRAQDKT